MNPTEWLLTEGRGYLTTKELVSGLCRHLVEDCGIPLSRLFCFVRILHPQVFANSYTWRRTTGTVDSVSAPYDELESALYRDSPCAVLSEGAAAIRRRLDIPHPWLDYPILHDLRAEGATDYVAMPVPFTDGRFNIVTVSTERPGGFSLDDLRQMDQMLPALGHILEFQTLRHTTATLLNTYLGKHTGERVLQGLVRRGDSEDVRAVICFCDLRDSTHLADSMPRADYLDLLNSFFDCVAGPILERGGEILDFIGDAVLAVFPIADSLNASYRLTNSLPVACENALATVGDIQERVARLNHERVATGASPLEYGLSIHEGDVTYGNIGVPGRLAFTVIGPAVNEAARLASMCKTFNKTVLISEEFARCFPGHCVSLGRHELRGVRIPQEVFTLRSH